MAPSTVHLPNGQNLTVTPVFGGLSFRSNELSNHHSPFPPGWTIVLNSEEEEAGQDEQQPVAGKDEGVASQDNRSAKRRTIHRFTKPTLRNDHLYISSISNPNSNEFRPAGSPTRQIAMMLWATLWWYFHQPEPDRRLKTNESAKTVEEGWPRGDWKINVSREGIFKGKVVLPKLERMGLIASENSSVGIYQDDRAGEGWHDMFVSRRSFWQLDPRIYLFTLSPLTHSPYPSGTPQSSRPSSPSGQNQGRKESPDSRPSSGLWSPTAPGPFHSSSHLPTFYPPPPTQYTFTNHIRHPIRPKPPRQGEVIYTRNVPSVGQYLSFRVASLSPKSIVHRGPTSTTAANAPAISNFRDSQSTLSEVANLSIHNSGTHPCDVDILNKWMNDPRVAHSWGVQGSKEVQESFLKENLTSKHSFPVIGCWDGKPFGYFEVYWVKEDHLGPLLGNAGDYDRGIHCLVGEQEFRGQHRVSIWLSALVHFCWLADSRTEVVVMEPRVDNEKLRKYTEAVGFFKEREISFPHKQSNLMKIRRDGWEAPAI